MKKNKKKALTKKVSLPIEFEKDSLFCFKENERGRSVESISQVDNDFRDVDIGVAYDSAVAKKQKITRKGAEKIYVNGLFELKNTSDSGEVDDLFHYNRGNGKVKSISESYPMAESVETKADNVSISPMQSIPVIKARAFPLKDVEEEVIKDRSLRMAMDFSNREKLIMVGEEIYFYNGIFFVQLKERELQNMIFKRYYKELSKGNSLSILSNAARLAIFCIKKQYEEFPVNSNIIVFENGTLEIDTKRFRPNSYKDLANSALGINYNSNRWDMVWTKRFLETIADGDDDLYELMLQVIGYILSNDTKAKSFFYLEGVGDAGKSRFCDLVASFFPVNGANKVSRIALQDLDGKFALGNLVNAKLNISEDLPDKPLSVTTVSKIKMLSDGNRQEAEAKYVQKFSFRPTCKFLFASNHPLRLKEYDKAFINRVVYIPFLNAIPKHKQDKNILEKMQRELPALFNHAFEAYMRLVTNGYSWAGAEKFKPRIEIANTGIVINKLGELRKFVEECCSFQEGYITATSELREAYFEFCQQHNYSPILGDRFSRELMEVLPGSVTRVKIGNQKRGFKGIRILKFYSEFKF